MSGGGVPENSDSGCLCKYKIQARRPGCPGGVGPWFPNGAAARRGCGPLCIGRGPDGYDVRPLALSYGVHCPDLVGVGSGGQCAAVGVELLSPVTPVGDGGQDGPAVLNHRPDDAVSGDALVPGVVPLEGDAVLVLGDADPGGPLGDRWRGVGVGGCRHEQRCPNVGGYRRRRQE